MINKKKSIISVLSAISISLFVAGNVAAASICKNPPPKSNEDYFCPHGTETDLFIANESCFSEQYDKMRKVCPAQGNYLEMYDG